MFAVRMPVRGIEPSEATKLKTHTFPGDPWICHLEKISYL